jgi:exopolysaccharide biosynthesis polyprenyl glycosylphosphotransferase
MLTRPSSPPLDVRCLQVEPPPRNRPSEASRVRMLYAMVFPVIADFMSVFAGTAAAAIVWEIYRGMRFHEDFLVVLSVSIQYSLVFVLLAKVHRLYAHSPSLLQIRDTANVIRISVISLVAVAVSVFYSHLLVPRMMLTAAWFFVTIILVFQKHLIRDLATTLQATSRFKRRAIIYGAGSDARRLYSCLKNARQLGVVPVAFVEANAHKCVIYPHDYRHRDFAPVFDGMPTDEVLTDMGITDIFVAQPGQSSGVISDICAFASSRRLNLSFLGTAGPYLYDRPPFVHIVDSLLISSYAGWEEDTLLYDLIKRVFDVVVAAGLIVMSAPMWMIAALAVRLTSPGPILFQQERIGKNGHPFPILKFRTMYVDAPKYGRSPEDESDPRITRAGKFLRKTSVDELPQLWNVLRGDMTLVGPRPEMPYIVNDYGAKERQRLSVPQGITGIWQLSADRKYAIHENIEYDLYYIENRGFFVDLAILAHTLLFAMNGI